MTDRRPMVRMVRTFMHKHPRRDAGLASVMAIAGPIALFMMVALVPIHVGSRASMAAQSGPLVVDGHVYNSVGSIVVGANVAVSLFDGTTFKDLQTATSDSFGFYTVTFGNGVWDLGYTIQVAASSGSDVGANQTIVDFDFMTVDVHLGTSVIPEFGGPALTILTVSAIGMMVVLYARSRGRGSP